MKTILYFILMTASISFAQENTVSTDLKKITNAELRQGKSVQATAFGTTSSSMGVKGFGIGRYIDAATIFQVEIGKGSTNSTGDWFGFSNEIREGDASLVNVTLKRFFGDSFYVRGGLGHRTASYKYQTGNTFLGWGDPNSPRSTYQFSGHSMGGLLAIGNQWNWKNFMIGCDWLSAWQPFSSGVDSESISETDPSIRSILAKSMQDQQHEMLRDSNVTLFAYAGLTF